MNGMLKINTVLTGVSTLLVALLGFLGRELYMETRVTHDAILSMSIRMVNHTEFDVAVTDIKNRQSAIEARQSALDLEIRNIKAHQ